VPTIGIGAGAACDGQILVFADLLGLTPGRKPRFVRQYADLRAVALAAITAYRDDVASGSFPSAAESYGAQAHSSVTESLEATSSAPRGGD